MNGSFFEGYTLYQVLWFFIVYAFLGWCTEVAYAAVNHGKFVNRGFLNGPYCPIYGFGVVLVVGVLTPLKDSDLVLFFGSVLLTSALEWMTGFVLEKVFHNKWWDYSEVPFNLNGYICLKFSIAWGFACIFVMKIFHPTVEVFVNWIPKTLGWIAVVGLLIIFTADAAVTAQSILKLNKRLEHMEEIAEKMKEISDHIGEDISENVLELMEKGETLKEKLQAEYEELARRRSFTHDRLLKAYPGMKSNRHGKALGDIRKNLDRKLERFAAELDERFDPADDTNSVK